jgi:hypothetical protein
VTARNAELESELERLRTLIAILASQLTQVRDVRSFYSHRFDSEFRLWFVCVSQGDSSGASCQRAGSLQRAVWRDGNLATPTPGPLTGQSTILYQTRIPNSRKADATAADSTRGGVQSHCVQPSRLCCVCATIGLLHTSITITATAPLNLRPPLGWCLLERETAATRDSMVVARRRNAAGHERPDQAAPQTGPNLSCVSLVSNALRAIGHARTGLQPGAPERCCLGCTNRAPPVVCVAPNVRLPV